MKKVLFILATVFTGYIAQAQVQSFGPTAGFNYAWLSDLSNASGRPSFNAGFTYNYSILESAGIGIEARYSEEGVKQDIGNATLTTKLNYIRVPLKFQYFFGKLGQDFRPKVFVGPSFGFLVGGKSEIRSGETTTTINSKDVYEGFDAGLHAGAGFNYRLAERTWLNFDVAYTHGLIDVAGSKSGSDAQNRLVNVNLGVAFGFGE
ncbi:MAG: PorT family protein [Bacteroidetes bacterium]|nr:PorT family protein [Bacteroidota bacterium]